MSGSIPSASPTACSVDVTGIHSPSFQDILSYLQNQIQGIFGSDIYLGNDSQDGQMIGIFAQAIYDTNSMAIAVYNSYSPSTAQGVGFSSVVKINGIARLLPTNSTVQLTIAGVVGSTIINGIASDSANNQWLILQPVVIPFSGQVTVTATAALSGNISALPNTITNIVTPTLGWQTVSNPTAAVPGAPLESDAALRLRQTTSTMLPSVSALDGIVGGVAAVPGVTRYAVYENDTNITDSNGIPGHSLSFVIEGGNNQTIADTIAAKKTPGAGTWGGVQGVDPGFTSVTVVDQFNIAHFINFFRPNIVNITVTVNIIPLLGFTTQVANDIVSAIVTYINNIPIGQSVFLSKVLSAANLLMPETNTFNIVTIAMSSGGAAPIAGDVTIAFNESAVTDPSIITITVPG